MKISKYILTISLSMALFSCEEKIIKDSETIKTTVSNGIATSTFKVWGNCSMCKETIEESLKIDGIKKSDWNEETKLITVEFDTSKFNLDQIQKNIAAAGYDNITYKGDDKAYSELPDCCQYDRK